jgi:2-keto-3-deoxy-6-phosphogluconate aldolase
VDQSVTARVYPGADAARASRAAWSDGPARSVSPTRGVWKNRQAAWVEANAEAVGAGTAAGPGVNGVAGRKCPITSRL